MRRRFAVIGAVALGLAGAVALAVVPSEPSQAASTANATFVVPADDGYGVAECATSACGKVVADQWCLAQGYGASVAFGFTDAAEVTGSIAARAVPAETRPFSITCAR